MFIKILTLVIGVLIFTSNVSANQNIGNTKINSALRNQIQSICKQIIKPNLVSGTKDVATETLYESNCEVLSLRNNIDPSQLLDLGQQCSRIAEQNFPQDVSLATTSCLENKYFAGFGKLDRDILTDLYSDPTSSDKETLISIRYHNDKPQFNYTFPGLVLTLTKNLNHTEVYEAGDESLAYVIKGDVYDSDNQDYNKINLTKNSQFLVRFYNPPGTKYPWPVSLYPNGREHEVVITNINTGEKFGLFLSKDKYQELKLGDIETMTGGAFKIEKIIF